MKPFPRLCMLVICAALVMLWGCRTGTPEADATGADHAADLLSKLTSVNESERFGVLGTVLKQVPAINTRDLEAALTDLREKNVSTLIYAYIKTKNEALYHLSAPALMTLENAAGAFPNIAYYYARVEPSAGVEALFRLYRSRPDQQLAICLALGEVPHKKAHDFLLAKARSTKSAGGSIVAHLSGMKIDGHAIHTSDLFWFMEQKLDREEVIGLSELNIRLTGRHLKSLWLGKGFKRNFAEQFILGHPEKYFEALRWMVKQYLQAGDNDMVRQFMLSDGMQSVTAPRVREFRDATLQKIRKPARQGA